MDYIRLLFGEFGLWLFSGLGILLAALLGWVSRQFTGLNPILNSLKIGHEDNKEAIHILRKAHEDHKTDLKDHKATMSKEMERLMTSVTLIDDSTRKRLDNLNERLDGIVDQNSSNYQSLAEQLTTMQQTLIAKQEDIIKGYRAGA